MMRQDFELPKYLDNLTGRIFLDLYDVSDELQKEIASNQVLFREVASLWCILFSGENLEKYDLHHSIFSAKEAFARLQLTTMGDKVKTTLATLHMSKLLKRPDELGIVMYEDLLLKEGAWLKDNQHKMDDLLSDLTVRSLNSDKLTLHEKLQLANELEANNKLEVIAKWSKFFKLSAKKKRQYHKQSTILKRGTTYGVKVERLKPIEYIRSDSPEAALDFVHRLSEGKVAMYDYKQRDKKIKGPLIVCYDESGSMKALDEQGKGFLVALLALAKQQKRDFIFIPFSGVVDAKEIQVFKKGRYKMAGFLAMLKSYSGGGTSFKAPLRYVLHYMNESKIGGDVLFITDGISHLDESFKADFIKEKEKRKFHMLSLLIGRNKHMGDLPEVSNEVLKLIDFKDGQHKKIFEL